MMRLREHGGWEEEAGGPVHNPHHWWVFDSRETTPKTCPLCLSLHGTHYRSDEITLAFPYHIHRTINTIRARAHMPRDPHCRCVLRWTGRSKDILTRPFGWLEGKRKVPDIPKTVQGRPVEDVMNKDLRKMRRKIVKHARECYG